MSLGRLRTAARHLHSSGLAWPADGLRAACALCSSPAPRQQEPAGCSTLNEAGAGSACHSGPCRGDSSASTSQGPGSERRHGAVKPSVRLRQAQPRAGLLHQVESHWWHSPQAVRQSSPQWQAARAFATFKLPQQLERKQQQQRDQQVRLVFEDGRHEVMLRSEAQRLAAQQRLDLIMVADKAQPPVVKLGEVDSLQRAQRRAEKEQRKREAEQRRKMSVKEVRIGALTAEHDLGLKLKQARGFLDKGFRVKLVVRFGHWQRTNGEARLRSVTAECKQWSHVTAPQANEKMARNTFMIYLTPGLGMTMPSQPAQAAAPAREQQQQQQPATAPSPPAAAAVGAA